MIHFLKHHDPQVRVDAVEIDPAIVKIADEYFDTRSGENVAIITADGFEYLKTTKQRYDVNYMDAFLKPSADTDGTGVPLRLKTIRFFKSIQEKLNPRGLVVFNLNLHRTTRNDLNTIRNAFAQVYVFRVPPTENLVVVASLVEGKEKASSLKLRAAELDRSFQAGFSFQQMVKNMVR
jgi:spermidine synthase